MSQSVLYKIRDPIVSHDLSKKEYTLKAISSTNFEPETELDMFKFNTLISEGNKKFKRCVTMDNSSELYTNLGVMNANFTKLKLWAIFCEYKDYKYVPMINKKTNNYQLEMRLEDLRGDTAFEIPRTGPKFAIKIVARGARRFDRRVRLNSKLEVETCGVYENKSDTFTTQSIAAGTSVSFSNGI
jgi:hypothetical protein